MARIEFNANDVAPDSGGIDPIPSGWYVAMIAESDIKPTADKLGAFVQLTYRVMEPAEFRGRIVIGRLNIQNQNPKAVEIGLAQLSAVCHAVNVLILNDTTQLHGISHKIKVELEDARTVVNENTGASKNYAASNNIRAYKPMSENVTIGPAPVAVPAAVPAPAKAHAAAAWAAAPAAAPVAVPAPTAAAGTPPWAAAAPVAAPVAAPATAPAATPPWAAAAPAPAAAPVQPPAAAPAAAVTPPWARPAA